MEVRIGLRVVRGPDWVAGDQDGGEGSVGTVVSGGRSDGAEGERQDVATVQWDLRGERHTYRCGAQGKYDLRVIDSGPAGVVHAGIQCTVCGSGSAIAGCVWQCMHCLRYYLCTLCYMQDRHSVWHHFIRIDTQNRDQRTKVQCRYLSGHRVPVRGVYLGATVVRGHDWRWSDQDGGRGGEGTVVEISGWHSESSRSVAIVKWRESGRKRKYRLGHKGKVDLLCSVAAEWSHCYMDHLAVLGAEFKAPSTPFICAGDRALLEMDLDLLKSSLEAIDAWNENIVDFLGKVGLVNKVGMDELEVTLVFTVKGGGFHVIPAALKKADGPDILQDDVVRVIDDIAEVHRLQKDGRGWEDDMALSLGQLGRVGLIIEDGSAVVFVNGKRWLFDPRCLEHARGEQPLEELTEVEAVLGMEMLWLTMQRESSPEIMSYITARGCSKVLADMLEKWPERVNAMHEGRSLLHVAAAEGRLNTARVLLEHNADITATDKTGETPLHNTAHYNHYPVAKLLLDAGSDVNKKGSSGSTPLHVAAALGFSRIVGLLLEHPSIKINEQNMLGDTPLHFACQGYWPIVTRQLLEAGADTTLLNVQAANPFLHAVVKGFLSGVELIMQYHPDIINEIKIDDGCSPLHVAAHVDHPDMLCYLAAMETCELEKKIYIEQTSLHVACREGQIRCVECLVGYGADVEATDSMKNTPMHFVLAKKNMKELSKWTVHLNQVHEWVSSADNSIQNVPVYVTVACFLASEGASLEAESLEGLTPLGLCPHDYRPLLQLFAKPERRGHYKGSLPRHPPPIPTHIPRPQKPETNTAASTSNELSVDEVTPTLDKATPTVEKTAPTVEKATPTDEKTTPTGNGDNSNKTADEGGQQPSPSPNTHSTSPKNVPVSGSCFLCEGPCDIRFQPCGHTAMCAECAEPVKRCPTCCNDVSRKIKIT